MEPSAFYRPFQPELCQGDIFECLPNIHLKSPAELLVPATLSGQRRGFEIGDQLAAGLALSRRAGVVIGAECDATRAMLMTFDCEIDKDKHRTIALIRPLDSSLPDQVKAVIRANQRFPFFHLPEQLPDLPESYVDFRRLATVASVLVDTAKRLAGLSDSARQQLLFQFFRYFTRIELKPEILGAIG